MMKLKNLLALGTAAAILFSAGFTGCSGSGESEQTGSETKTSSAPTQNPDKTDSAQAENDGSGQDEDALSDTVRWFNASYAILTEINGWDYNIFAGLKPSFQVAAMEQASLEEWWGVTDRQTADETLDWILNEGHRADFAADMSYLDELGLGEFAEDERTAVMAYSFEMTEEEAQNYVNAYKMYEQYGAEAIDAWDYCRALNLMSFFYLAGYYNEEEALDKSLKISQVLQGKFDSWDALVDSYLRGYEYWAEESSDARRAVYEDLKSRDDNPYSVDYNTKLEKTW